LLKTSSLLEFAHSLLHIALPTLEKNFQCLVEDASKGDILQGDTAGWKAAQKKEIVTKGEQEAEALMRERVAQYFPEHDIAGEEGGYSIRQNPYVWVFDPIDGTAAMLDCAIQRANGIMPSAENAPFFGITIGLMHNYVPILGLVYDIIHHRLWSGGIDIPVCSNNLAVEMPSPVPLADAVVSCTAPHIMFSHEQYASFDNLVQNTKQLVTNRNCIGFMQLLDNTVNIVWEGDLAFHDIVPLLPILDRAGFKVTDEQGNPFVFSDESYHKEYRVIATHPALYSNVLNHSKYINDSCKNDEISQEGLYTRKF
jgi:fructose-1,6-bisphosphatase/inositol monophosphatase family enzyme